MKQYVKIFCGFSESVDNLINDFLKEHHNYSISKITFCSKATDRALVVFDVEEETFRNHY